MQDENCEAVFFSLKNLGTRKAHRVRKSSLQISNSTVNVDNSNEMMNKKLKKSFPNEGDENQYLKITTGKELFAIKGLPVDEDMGQDSPTLELRSDFDAEISENDGLEDLWNEMSLAMECSKVCPYPSLFIPFFFLTLIFSVIFLHFLVYTIYIYILHAGCTS